MIFEIGSRQAILPPTNFPLSDKSVDPNITTSLSTNCSAISEKLMFSVRVTLYRYNGHLKPMAAIEWSVLNTNQSGMCSNTIYVFLLY